MQFYNTLTKSIAEFKPLLPNQVSIYACGPTVYDYAHIGNFRTYTLTDLVVRALKRAGYSVKYVMNITDVGHLVSDADSGEDKMEKGARREGKSAWDIAKYFTDVFLSDSTKLNLLEPDVRPKPTEHIPEQIAMVQALLDRGYAYVIDDGIYFDTSKFSGYGALTGQNLEELKAGARVEMNPQKRNLTDFALWKFSYPMGRAFDSKLDDPKLVRQMEWDSPWGKGFPGWHIECSAMIRKHLGDQIDIHTGGMDLVPVHHTNEIAQSEATTGKVPFVEYWVHGQFIQVDGEKMSKSKGNFYRLADIEAKGYDPLALRYLYLTAHYRTFLNFTWNGLDAAQNALRELRNHIVTLREQMQQGERVQLSPEKLRKVDEYRQSFTHALSLDLNLPRALSVVWEVVKSNIPAGDKYDLLLDFDEVLGLDLAHVSGKPVAEIPAEIQQLGDKRFALRAAKKFSEADAIREQLTAKGFEVKDTATGTVVTRKP